LSSLVIAAAALATMLALAPVLALLPNATLAAIVIVYSLGLIQPSEFRAIRRVRSMEFRWAMVAAGGVLVFGTLQGIVVAIVLSLVGLASQTAHPRVSVIGRKRGADVLRPLSPEHPDDETFDGLLILRPEGRLFFLNAQSVADQVKRLIVQHAPRVVVLDLSRVPDIEYSALQTLRHWTARSAREEPILWIVGLNPGVLEMVRHAGLDADLGPDRLLFNAREAIERYARPFGGAASPAGEAQGSTWSAGVAAADPRMPRSL
jgi:MFS superfamily sulfate permease-like transporter